MTRHRVIFLIICAETVSLYISFVNEIYAVTVAQVIPQRGLGVMRRAHGIDIMPLHGADILHHGLTVDGMTRFMVMFMQVDTVYLNRLAVYKQLAVTDFDRAEPHLGRSRFDDFAIFADQRE